MKDRPILFNGAMVCAILDGSKTQTRRPYKVRKHPDIACEIAASELVREEQHVIDRICPYGASGDRLYVRETWAQPTTLDPGPTIYRADYPDCVPAEYINVPPADEVVWRPSIHMPKALSRITLEVTGVRVERLNDCSDTDALAEGVDRTNTSITGYARERYQHLWESINGVGSWSVNPWVWVVEFRRVS